MSDKNEVTETIIRHQWPTPKWIQAAMLIATVLLFGYILGLGVGYYAQLFWTGEKPPVFSDFSTGLGVMIDLYCVGHIIAWALKRTRQVIGIKDKAARRPVTAASGGNTLAYSINTAAAIVERSVQRKRNEQAGGDGCQVVTVMDKFVLSDVLFVAYNAYAVKSDTFIRWARAVERRESKYGIGRGASENYWTRTYAKSGLDWWGGTADWKACIGVVEEAQYKLPPLFDEARRRGWPDVPEPCSVFELIYFAPGNKRRLRYGSQRIIQIAYAVHYREPRFLYDGVWLRKQLAKN